MYTVICATSGSAMTYIGNMRDAPSLQGAIHELIAIISESAVQRAVYEQLRLASMITAMPHQWRELSIF
ncbi:hypothetical protein NDU88_007860 [Pleurodeles waltl]|uniref:Uncharacterized protein n=1 Tax=Pleurodeles waltl TaxID=8319 RepID=A0AAV7N730_PLEWA|nr:hypothetical protein NDU88_007860 [Pleurodeles waltl]